MYLQKGLLTLKDYILFRRKWHPKDMMGEIASDTKTAIYTWSLMTKYVHIHL